MTNYKEIAGIIKEEICNGIGYENMVNKLADHFEREDKKDHWVFCLNCADKGIDSRIAVDKQTIFPIDCDCGNVIEGFNRQQFIKGCGHSD